MLNRSLWLQRCLAQSPRAHLQRRWRGDHASTARQYADCLYTNRRDSTGIGKTGTLWPAHNGHPSPGSIVSKRFFSQTFLSREGIARAGLHTQKSYSHRPLSLRHTPRRLILAAENGNGLPRTEGTGRHGSTKSLGRLRVRTRYSVYSGGPEARVRHAMRMALYRCSKSRAALWDRKAENVKVRLVRDALSTTLDQKIGASLHDEHEEDVDEEDVILCCSRRPSALARDAYNTQIERYLPYWSIASRRIRQKYDRPWEVSRNPTTPCRYSIKSYARRQSLSHMLKTSPAMLWTRLSARCKSRYWMSILLYSLEHDPMDASRIIESILLRRRCNVPNYIAEDVVADVCTALLQPYPDSIARLRSETPRETQSIAACSNMVESYLKHSFLRCGSVVLRPRTLALLTRHLGLASLKRILAMLDERGYMFDARRIRGIVYRLVKARELDEAMDWLSRLPIEERGTDETLQLCVFMLRFDFANAEDLYRLKTDILSAMLEIGIRPNRQMHDVVILNAMEAGDRQTAWGSHHITQEHGVPMTAFTYSILLKGVEHGDGVDTVSAIYEQAKMDGCLQKSPVLGASLLNALYHVDELQHRPKPFRRMLSIYTEIFDITPLHDIGIGLEVEQADSEKGELMNPPVEALGSIIIAWLRENFWTPELPLVYRNFIHALKYQTSRIALLGHYHQIYHAFMIAFSSRGEALKECTMIFQTMENPEYFLGASRSAFSSPRTLLRHPFPNDLGIYDVKRVRGLQSAPLTLPSLDSREQAGDSNRWHIKIPQPDWKTWNILMYAFLRNGEPQAAATILENMQQAGITPNESTWNSLISGYARLGMIDDVVQSIRHRTDAGFEPNDFSINPLKRIKDREQLLAAFARANEDAAQHRLAGSGQDGLHEVDEVDVLEDEDYY